MPKLNILFVCFIFLLGSCKKEAVRESSFASVSDAVSNKAETSKGWYATYGIMTINGYIPQDTLEDDSLIHDGYISLPNSSDSISSSINYDIPEIYNLNGDSITFSFVLSDLSSDQNIRLIGSAGYVYVEHFHESWGIYTPDFGRSEDVGYQSFSNFTPVTIVLKRKEISVYTGKKLVIQTSYTGKVIGELKSIVLGYSSYIRCDEVRLYNSYNQQLLMKERFNLQGKSHTVFY
jgi:hypothetical protein